MVNAEQFFIGTKMEFQELGEHFKNDVDEERIILNGDMLLGILKRGMKVFSVCHLWLMFFRKTREWRPCFQSCLSLFDSYWRFLYQLLQQKDHFRVWEDWITTWGQFCTFIVRNTTLRTWIPWTSFLGQKYVNWILFMRTQVHTIVPT